MPLDLHLPRSGAHRLACLSLYRALLRACHGFTTPPPRTSALPSRLKHLVRFRFRHDQDLQSPRQIRDALDFGRHSLQLIVTAVQGSQPALNELTANVSSTAKLASAITTFKEHCAQDGGNYPVHVQAKKEYIGMLRDPASYRPRPEAIPILSRPAPLSKIKGGRRIVPRLVVTQMIPFLRYGRKHPYALNIYIRGAIRKTTRFWDLIGEMDNTVAFAADENAWDHELRTRHGIYDDEEEASSASWTSEIENATKLGFAKYNALKAKRMEKAKQLYTIMVNERALAFKEKQMADQKKKRQKITRLEQAVHSQTSTTGMGPETAVHQLIQ